MASNLEGTELLITDTVSVRKRSSSVSQCSDSCLVFGSFCFGCICDILAGQKKKKKKWIYEWKKNPRENKTVFKEEHLRPLSCWPTIKDV